MILVLTKWPILEDWLVQRLSSNKDNLSIILSGLKLDTGLIRSGREQKSVIRFLWFTVFFTVHVDFALESYIMVSCGRE
jgi:hypothetical protein